VICHHGPSMTLAHYTSIIKYINIYIEYIFFNIYINGLDAMILVQVLNAGFKVVKMLNLLYNYGKKNLGEQRYLRL
jgi:hypothetical protein